MDFSDAVFYVAAQFIGGISGVVIATDPAVRYVVTIPGRYGNATAFVAELTISFILMITVLFVSNRKDVARWLNSNKGTKCDIEIRVARTFAGGRVCGL